MFHRNSDALSKEMPYWTGNDSEVGERSPGVAQTWLLPGSSEGGWLAPVPLGKPQPSLPVFLLFWLLNILSELYCSHPTAARSWNLIVYQKYIRDPDEQHFEEEMCAACTVWVYNGRPFKMKPFLLLFKSSCCGGTFEKRTDLIHHDRLTLADSELLWRISSFFFSLSPAALQPLQVAFCTCTCGTRCHSPILAHHQVWPF